MSTTVIGVDVGGTKVAVSLMRDGRLLESRLEPTEHGDANSLLDQLARLIESAAQHSDTPVSGVGLGVPSVIEWSTGRVRATVNLPLRDVPLRAELRERLGLPVFVDNDANCAALSEAHDADGYLDVHNLVMFTIGTGVGGGIVINGRIYRGATGAAGEIGHMIIGLDLDRQVPAPGRFPQAGSLESLAAGRALDELAVRAAAEHPDSVLAGAAARGAIAGPDVVRAAQDGDPLATSMIGLLGARLGIGIANAINLFDPEVVAIGGGVSVAGDLLLRPARETARGFILPGVGTQTEIRMARSGPEAGVRGAALLAAQELEHRRDVPSHPAAQSAIATLTFRED